MNKDQYKHKMAIYLLLASSSSLLSTESFAKTETKKTQDIAIDRVAALAKHKAVNEKAQRIEGEAALIEAETQKAIVALDAKDSKSATAILKVVSTKLDNLLKDNPGLNLVPAEIDADVIDFAGSNKDVSKAISTAEDMLKHGKLQTAREVVSDMASEIRLTTTSIPLGTYPAAIKQIIPLIDAGKLDQATVDLNEVLGTLVVETDVMPLPVLRAEELLTVAAELEHKVDLTKDKSRAEIQKFTLAAKNQLELAQLLGYGNKEDYKILYKGIDGIDKVIFTENSAVTWKKIKADLAQFKDRLKALEDAAERTGNPVK